MYKKLPVAYKCDRELPITGTDDMMVIGADVGSENHYARAFTNRKIELSSKPFKFTNRKEGF